MSYDDISYPLLQNNLESQSCSDKCRHMSIGKKVCLFFVCPLIILGILFASACFIDYIHCNDGGSTSEYCLCDKYTYKTSEKQTCIGYFNDDHTQMDCMMDTGYWHCTTEGNCGDKSGWGNCTFYESNIQKKAIPTCDAYIFGREICHTSTKTCCWYPSDESF